VESDLYLVGKRKTFPEREKKGRSRPRKCTLTGEGGGAASLGEKGGRGRHHLSQEGRKSRPLKNSCARGRRGGFLSQKTKRGVKTPEGREELEIFLRKKGRSPTNKRKKNASEPKSKKRHTVHSTEKR